MPKIVFQYEVDARHVTPDQVAQAREDLIERARHMAACLNGALVYADVHVDDDEGQERED